MREFKGLTFERILELHGDVMANTGDPPSAVRSESSIRAALERAAWGPFEGDGDVAERAAMLLRGIAQEHPFSDGNKRTGLFVTDSFLQLNGSHMLASADELVSFALRVAQGELSLLEMAAWIRDRLEKD